MANNNSNFSLINSDWLPSEQTIALLKTNLKIDADFIQVAIPEFVIYWTERNEPRPCWQTQFIKNVRHQWNKRNAMESQYKQFIEKTYKQILFGNPN